VVAAHEFYDYAEEHFGWAETARTERERAIFLQMAAAWLEVAQQWEAKGSERFCSVPDSLTRFQSCESSFESRKGSGCSVSMTLGNDTANSR
jgi:hypothetical protein